MSKRIDRRQALGAFGSVSLAGLLAACGSDSSGGAASVPTTAGETPTVEPKTTTSDESSALFDDAASCALTVEETRGRTTSTPTRSAATSARIASIFDASLVATAKADGDGYLGVMTFDVRSA